MSTKYEVGERLGRGGMGDVYRAYDPALRRVVAIKYLRSQDPALVERFLREARLQARVEHELVCRVYDAGNDDGVPYICMEYVEGRTLDEAAADMTRADKVAVVRDVALAVHAAHETGLIHRDIKPQNVLVERGTAGWRPHVMDFGLARDPASPGDTKTGDLLGTPWYMSPEQAQGDVRRLDRRTDVYSLGALLYRLLVGRTPFEGTALEVLVKVVRAEAVPPRRLDPALPIDLDTIVVRCLEKDPARRYPSALALARDLERHARGEAIVARALTPLDRLRRSARRNRAPVAVIAVASLLSLAALGTAWKARRDGEARAAAAQRFGAEAARLQDLLRSAELLPAHDTRVERAGIRADMKRLEAEMARMGAVALGPGHYALGQGFLALGDDARARTELERAWSLGYRTPAVAFALGQALGGLYRRALEDAQGFGSPALRDAHRREAEIALRDPALGYLRTGGSDAAQPRAYIDGLVAFHERRYADAVQGARAALQQAPWLYEARLLEGDVYFAQGLQARDRGAYDVALANNECAGAVYRELTETARSFRRGYQQQCLRLVKEQEIRMRLGRETQETFIAADAACRLSLGIDPDDGETYSRLAQLYWRRGEILRDRGSDNREVVKQAAALGEEATRRVPELYGAWASLGMAWWSIGEAEVNDGLDPRPSLRKAVDALDAGVRRRPHDFVAPVNLAGVWLDWARYEVDHGLDPEDAFAAGLRVCRSALAVAPEAAPLHGAAGGHLYLRAQYEARKGRDPRAALADAAASYGESLRLNPNNVYARFNRSEVFRIWSDYLIAIGEDPEGRLAEALADADRAVQINARLPYPHRARADACIVRAVHALRTGADPRPALADARRALGQALAIRPRYAAGHTRLAQTEAIEAEFLLRTGPDPTRAIDQGLRAVRRAGEITPGFADAEALQIQLVVLRARWDLHRRRSPAASLAEARRGLAALSTRSNGPGTQLDLADLCRWEAEAALARGDHGGARRAIEEGRAAVTKALAANPAYVRAASTKQALETLQAALD